MKVRFACWSTIAMALVVLACGFPAEASISFSLGEDFSATSNPNGVWSYGYSTSVGGTATLFTEVSASAFGYQWAEPSAPWYQPVAVYNPTASGVIYINAALDAGQFALAPGTAYAVARFTAPEAGTYTVSTLFEGMQWPGGGYTTTDVHVLLNNASLFSGYVSGWVGRTYVSSASRQGTSPEQAFAATLDLNTNDVLDFVVGSGGNGFYNDFTGVTANITQETVPEPSTLAIWSCLGVCGIAWRRKKRAA